MLILVEISVRFQKIPIADIENFATYICSLIKLSVHLSTGILHDLYYVNEASVTKFVKYKFLKNLYEYSICFKLLHII